MLRKNFLILAIMVLGIGMLIWTFFGGKSSSDGESIPQDITTGFVEIINDTGNDLDIGDFQIDSGKIFGEDDGYVGINVMMPRYFYNSGWKKFAQDLYENGNIYMNFIFVDDLNSYRDRLYDANFSDADLFLYPYDWNEKISVKIFSSGQDMQGYFDQLLNNPIFQGDKISFMPFAADPMVIYVLPGLSVNSFYKISELVLNRESTMPLSFPLFFGIDTEDIEGDGFLREYQDIMRYALLHYFKTNNDSINLQTWIDSNVLEKYNMHDLRTILDAIYAPECKHFPSLCFQIYNFVGVRFGFLSDRDVVNTYFTGKKANFDRLIINSLPFSKFESPVRIWGRGIRGSLEDNEKFKAISKLIDEYLMNHSKYSLWNSTLPVFRSIEEGNGLLDNEYIGLRGYILQAGGDYMNSLRSMTKFKELIGHEITAKEYLK